MIRLKVDHSVEVVVDFFRETVTVKARKRKRETEVQIAEVVEAVEAIELSLTINEFMLFYHF